MGFVAKGRERRRVGFAALAGLALALATAAGAQEMFIYPEKGQSAEQQASDKGQCQQWATDQTGFDPLAGPSSVSAAPPTQGGAVRGAARGAAVGAAVGAIAGDAGKGAAAGAAAGGIGGGLRRRDAERQVDQQNQQQTDAADAKRAEFQRAMGACLEGRGYTVK
jgi:Glycine-zipper domain